MSLRKVSWPSFFLYFRDIRKKRSHEPKIAISSSPKGGSKQWKLNIKARRVIREFLNANLWLMHLFAFDIDWSWNIFTSHNFCSVLIEQLINLEQVRTDNLKFRTDLQDPVMDGWSVTQHMIVYKDRSLKKSSESKIKNRLVNTGH